MSLKLEKIAAELREFSDRMGENIYENVKDGMENGTESTTNRKTAKSVKWYMPRA